MAQEGSENGVTEGGVGERLQHVRSVVYDDGELIDPGDLDDALRQHGVTVTESEDGTPAYEDVPRSLSLSACFLAVVLRKDPAAFLE